MKIILIGNKAQHGKDTFANMLREELEIKGNSCSIIHFADCLKFICKEFFKWDGEKNVYGRSLLQTVGNKMREVDEHFWTDFVARYIKFSQTDYVIIPDWRHKEEYERLLEYFDYNDIITINIMRFVDENTPFITPGMTEEQLNHKSEIDLDGYLCHYTILNITLEELRESAAALAEELSPTETYEMTITIGENV